MSTFSKRLLAYYDAHRRILPWREDPKPYHVWLSEIMLQQTRVDTVIDYFERFLKALPGISYLAAAQEEALLKLWEGLGYYSRVRNMHKAAQLIMEKFDGQLPKERTLLESLPGIGSYTAGAILSIAYGQPEVAVDGNMIRVMSRVLAYGEDASQKESKKFIEEALKKRMDAKRPGDFNQAMMDVGATLCIPNGQPLCEKCPLSKECLSYKEGNPLSFPNLPAKKPRKKENHTVFLIFKKGKVIMTRREEKGVLRGLWQFPMVKGHLKEKEAIDYLQDRGFQVEKIEKGPKKKHIFTHLEWHMISYVVWVKAEKGQKDWISRAEMGKKSIPTAFKPYFVLATNAED